VSPVAANEFSRIALLSSLPGARLADLASRMQRETVQPGKTVVIEGEPGERFYVVLEGMLEVSQAGRGQRTLLRPGDYFGEVALAMDIPRTASVRAVTPATVASCDKATFDEFVRPLFADDGAL
jgi:ATP-binding cassette subfamily B protein